MASKMAKIFWGAFLVQMMTPDTIFGVIFILTLPWGGFLNSGPFYYCKILQSLKFHNSGTVGATEHFLCSIPIIFDDFHLGILGLVGYGLVWARVEPGIST